jgi:cysteine desulfuration protein SufE
MSSGLKYDDLTAAEQRTYHELVRRINQMSQGGEEWSNRQQDHAHNIHDPAVHTHTPPPARQRRFGAAVRCLYEYGKRVVERYRRPPRSATSIADLAQFLRTQAAQRGCDTIERASFPQFPAVLEAFNTASPIERDAVAPAYPDALHHILATFRAASSAQRLELLVAYAETLPELPEALQRARDTMEQVDECATPVFLLAQLHQGTVHYYLDVPRDAPTMRGFAGLLHASLNGATPTAIAATPDDLCQQLGLQKALGALRVRGLTALLRRMKRNASDLASAV